MIDLMTSFDLISVVEVVLMVALMLVLEEGYVVCFLWFFYFVDKGG